MDTSLAVGTRSDAQAQAFMQKRAIPRPVTKVSNITEPPMRMPTTSVAQLQQRHKAELAQQGGFPPSEPYVDKDLV